MDRWLWQDLVLYTGAVYGISWFVTKSRLLAQPRELLASVPFFGKLVQCIVCTSAWVAIAWMVVGEPGLLSAEFQAHGPVDAAMILGWTMCATWCLGRVTGDAE